MKDMTTWTDFLPTVPNLPSLVNFTSSSKEPILIPPAHKAIATSWLHSCKYMRLHYPSRKVSPSKSPIFPGMGMSTGLRDRSPRFYSYSQCDLGLVLCLSVSLFPLC